MKARFVRCHGVNTKTPFLKSESRGFFVVLGGNYKVGWKGR